MQSGIIAFSDVGCPVLLVRATRCYVTTSHTTVSPIHFTLYTDHVLIPSLLLSLALARTLGLDFSVLPKTQVGQFYRIFASISMNESKNTN